MAITYVAAGTGAAQTATVIPPLPAGIVANDLLVLVIEEANQATSISNPAGGTWTSTPSGHQGTGTAASVTATGVEVYWSKYNGTQTAPTVADAGDHTAARIYAFRGVHATTPINASAGATSPSSTALSAPSVVTTAADCWVLVAATLMDDAQDFGATWTNTNLAGITVRNASFGHSLGNDGRLILVTGEKAAAGAVGPTTNTLTAASVKAILTVALTPETVAGGAVTLTAPGAKPQAVPVSPVGQPGTATLTPGPFRADAVALEPAAIAGTSLTAPTIRAVASPVDPVGTGPGAGVATPAVLKAQAVAVDPVPQPVTITLTPAVAKTQPGSVAPIATITETFNKADGTLGPNLTWTRKVYLAATQLAVTSNQARHTATTPASEIDHSDLVVPTPNFSGNDQQVTISITALTFSGVPNYAVEASVVARMTLLAGDTDFCGYVATLSYNDDLTFPPNPAKFPAYWFGLARYDHQTEFENIGPGIPPGYNLDGTFAPGVRGVQVTGSLTFPATLTLTARGDQIFATLIDAAAQPGLVLAATDATYTTGSVAVRSRLNIDTVDTGTATFDNFVAGPASPGPETTTTPDGRIPEITLSAARLFQQARDVIDGDDETTPPADIYDGGDLATPPADIVDANIDVVTLNPAQMLVWVPGVFPAGTAGSTVTLTPATLRATPVAVTPASSGSTEATPTVLKATAVPPASVIPGVVTTTITPANAVAAAVAVSPATLPGAVTLTPAVAELQTGTTAPAGSGAMSIPPVTMRAVAVAVSPVGVGPSSVTATPVTARFIPVAPASVVPGVVTTTATAATVRLAAVAVIPQAPVATTLTPAVLRIQAVAFIWVTVDLDIVIGPTRLRAATTTAPTRGTGTELGVAVTRPPHEIEVTRNRAATTTSVTRDRSRTTLSPTRPRAQTATSGTTRQGIGVGATRDGQEP